MTAGEAARALPATLESVADDARNYIASAKAPATRRAYRSDWAHFAGWCDLHDRAALPAEPDTVALYLSDLARTAKPATLQRRLSSISQAHQAAGHPTPTTDPLVRAVHAGIRRTQGTAPTVKAPAVTAELRAMITHLPGDLRGVRDRALDVITKAVRAAVPRGQRRTHLSAESDSCRRQILRVYVDLDVDPQVVIADHPGGDDQPVRDRCLRVLLRELGRLNVQAMLLDTRQEHRDVLDRRTIAQAITAGGAPRELHYRHHGSRGEPLLWLPDAFGWAYGAGGLWRKLIAPKVTVTRA